MQRKSRKKSSLVNKTGYTPGYSTENNPVNFIPSQDITMANTPYPLHATPLDQNGNPIGQTVMMQPGEEYRFGGASYVAETPVFGNGGEKSAWISDKIGKLIREGYKRNQATAIAYSMYENVHGNGGTQVPMYQFAGQFPKPPMEELDPMEAVNAFENEQAQKGYTPYGDVPTKEGITQDANMIGDTSAINPEPSNLKSKYVREAATDTQNNNGNQPFQFFNPYAGVDTPSAGVMFGQSLEKGDALGSIASGSKLLLGTARNILGGMGQARRNNYVSKQYYEKQREGMTGSGREVMAKFGGYYEDGGEESMDDSTPNFDYDKNSARDTWEAKTGMPWSEAKRLGYTDGSAIDNKKLLGELNSSSFKRQNLRKSAPQEDNGISISSEDADTRKLQSGIVVDKRTNTNHVIENGKIIKSYPVLTGSNVEYNENRGDAEYLDRNPSKKGTPKGNYFMQPVDEAYGMPGFALNPIKAFGEAKPKAKNLGVHVTYDPENRDKLYEKEDKERAASYGCVNCKKPDMRELTQRFTKGDTAIIVDSKLPKDRAFLKKMGISQYQDGGEEDGLFGDIYNNELVNKPGYSSRPNRYSDMEPIYANEAPSAQEAQQQIYQEQPQLETLKYDKNSARDTWEAKTGLPWSEAKKLGYTSGTAKDNMKLLAELNDPRFKKERLRRNPITQEDNKTYQGGQLKEVVINRQRPNSQQNNGYDEKAYESIITQGSKYFGSPRWASLMNTAGANGENAKSLSNKDRAEFFAAQKAANDINQTREVEDYFSGKTSGGRAKLEATRDSYGRGNLSSTEAQKYEEWLQKADNVNAFKAKQNQLRDTFNKNQQSKINNILGDATELPSTRFFPQLRQTYQKPNFEEGGYYQDGGEQQVAAQAMQALAQGADPQQVMQMLVQNGIPQDQAVQLVQAAMAQIQSQGNAPQEAGMEQGTPQMRRGGIMHYQEGGEEMDEQMEGEDEGAEGETPNMEQIESQVEEALKQGADPQQVLQQLVQMGMPQDQAIQMIQEILQEIQGGETQQEAPEQGTPQMKKGGEFYLNTLKGKRIKDYTFDKTTGNYIVSYE